MEIFNQEQNEMEESFQQTSPENQNLSVSENSAQEIISVNEIDNELEEILKKTISKN